MGRPAIYTDETTVCVSPNGTSKLQTGGQRRALINVMIENGGCMTLAELDAVWGFSVRETAVALIRADWISVSIPGCCRTCGAEE